MMTLPIEFKERMRALLGDEAEMFFSSVENGEAVRSFRVNPAKLSAEELEALSPNLQREKMPFPKGGYYTKESHPGSHPCHHAGMIYVQDPSAMATVCAIEVKKGMKILDTCSAPGGKTTQLAALTGDFGIVVANEYEGKRASILHSNIERLGCRNTVILNHDTKVLGELYPDTFDLVLADAPCSGEGMFRKNPLAVEEWSIENVKMCAERQREILGNVVRCVKKGGYLIYSTCTFSLEENEMNVDWLLDQYPEFALCEVTEELKNATSDGIMYEGCSSDMRKTRRFYPHISRGEGQFIALFKRQGEHEGLPENVKKSKKKAQMQKPDRIELQAIALAEDFIRENLTNDFFELPYKLTVRGDRIYLSPNINLPDRGVVAPGVIAGEIMNKRFVPHHQLFTSFGQYFVRKISLDVNGELVKDYLRGLEIDVEYHPQSEKSQGYAAVLVGNVALGGGKISGQKCKNHYPKGLRNKF